MRLWGGIPRLTRLLEGIKAILTFIVGSENWWMISLVLTGLKGEAKITIKTAPETLIFGMNRKNYKVLYYLCLLRNKHRLIFKDGRIEFPPHRIKIPPEQTDKEELHVICSAFDYGLQLTEYEDSRLFLVRLKYGHATLKFVIRRKRTSDLNSLRETFIVCSYQKVCQGLSGKTVLDIGAYIGDTPIMFSHSGARTVYAYEPNQEAYYLTKTNLILNNIKNVKLFNKGVSNEDGKLVIPSYGTKENVLVDTISLGRIMRDRRKIDLLKMDCEGCEFLTIPHTGQDFLRRINEMIIEYHDEPTPVVQKLEKSGFEVKVERPWDNIKGKPVGFLYAKKSL